MTIDSIRIYAEVLEQGMDFKEYLQRSGLVCPIQNVYAKKIHGEICDADSIIERLRKSKDADVLITVISGDQEYPLLMIEYSTAVPTDDHKMQRSDVYYWGAVYRVPIMKIYPANKGMNQNFGGGDKISLEDELLLSRRMGAVFYPIQWEVIGGTDVLDTKDSALSCMKENSEIQETLNSLLLSFQKHSSFDDFYVSLFRMPNKKCEKAACKEFLEGRDPKALITDSTRFRWCGDRLIAKINRFGHAMDPDRGVLYFVNMLVGVENTMTEIQINRSSVFHARGGYKSLFDAAPKEAEMCEYVKHIIRTRNNIFTEEDALYILKTVLGLPEGLIQKETHGQYMIKDADLYDFLMKHPGMTSKSIFFLSTALILTDVNRQPICTISWGADSIKKYLKRLYHANYTPTKITTLTYSSAKEDIVTFASAELYKKLKFGLLAVSYPGAQGDRCILIGQGRKVLRTYIDLIAYEKDENGATVYLEECKDNIEKSFSDAIKLNDIVSDGKKVNALKILYKKITGHDNIFAIYIGIGAKLSRVSKPLNADYIFMFDIDDSVPESTIINYNIAIINTALAGKFSPLADQNGKLIGTLKYPKLYVIQ